MAMAKPVSPPEHGPVLDATEARSGRPGVSVLWVLLVSLALLAGVFVALLAGWGPHLSGPGGQVTAGSQPYHAPAPPRTGP
jgi:hypothetical protein